MALSKSCEDKLNSQINAELEAGYSYLALSQYFSRSDVALPNIAKFFEKSSDEEMQHAKNFIEYQNKRGGTCVFTNIKVSTDFLKQTQRKKITKLIKNKTFSCCV